MENQKHMVHNVQGVDRFLNRTEQQSVYITHICTWISHVGHVVWSIPYGLSDSLELYSISISPFCFSFIQIIPQSAVYTGHIIIGCCTSVCSWFICSQVFYHSFSKISSWIDSFLLSHEKVLYIWLYEDIDRVLSDIRSLILSTLRVLCALLCIYIHIYGRSPS